MHRRRVQAPSVPHHDSADSSSEESEKEGGFLANLTPEAIRALEEKKAKLAAGILARREQEAAARAAAEKEAKKSELKHQKLYVKNNKLCAQNRIYEDPNSGWYICEVCDKKFNDPVYAEDHIKTEKHKRNLDWYATRPLPTDGEAYKVFTDQLPDYVRFDEESEFYICELCNAKAASIDILEVHFEGQNHKKKLAWEEQTRTLKPPKIASSSTPTPQDPATLPPYCQWDKLGQQFVCRWCDKKAPCVDMLETHLIGKEHAKKASNIGMAPYGHPDHLDQAIAYTDKYGFDLWARREHWPASIEDDHISGCWKCLPCNKKFLTPSAVNDHLLGHSPKFVEKLPTRPSRPAPTRPSELVQPAALFDCTLCLLPFGSAAELALHEANDNTHRSLLLLATDHAPKTAELITGVWTPADDETIDL
jgi:hypothetical protein